jgi:hypothetical protein
VAYASDSDKEPTDDTLWCPSARPEQAGAVVFGVRTDANSAVRIGYLSEEVPVTDSVLDLAQSVSPLEVFRFAAPCAETGCAHFADNRCGLASRIVARVPVVASIAPACAVRSKCRWWAQEGVAACQRCPQVVTSESGLNKNVAEAALPVVVELPTTAAMDGTAEQATTST